MQHPTRFIRNPKTLPRMTLIEQNLANGNPQQLHWLCIRAMWDAINSGTETSLKLGLDASLLPTFFKINCLANVKRLDMTLHNFDLQSEESIIKFFTNVGEAMPELEYFTFGTYIDYKMSFLDQIVEQMPMLKMFALNGSFDDLVTKKSAEYWCPFRGPVVVGELLARFQEKHLG